MKLIVVFFPYFLISTFFNTIYSYQIVGFLTYQFNDKLERVEEIFIGKFKNFVNKIFKNK